MATTKLSHAQPLRIAQRRSGEAWFIHAGLLYANDSQVTCRIVSDRGCRRAPAIGQRDFNTSRVMHHMAVRQNQAIRGENEA